MSDVQHPHDRFAKETISRRESAQSLVREYLPQDVVELLDISTLKPARGSWVDANLKEYFADCLFHCEWAEKQRRRTSKYQIFVLLLIEHKSEPDGKVRLQLLQYQQQCWTEHLKHGKLPLPIVIPLVLYHGKSVWRDSCQFADQFGEIPAALLRFVPQFEYRLLDISAQSDTEIAGDPWTRVALNLLHWAYQPDEAFQAELPNLLAQLPLELATQLKSMEPIFQYLASTRMLNAEQLGAALHQAFPEGEDLVKSFVEEARQEGRAEGLEKGLEQGLEQGRAAMALQFLRRKFGHEAIGKTLASRIEKLPLADLEQLGDKIFDFETRADLQRWLTSRK